MSKSDCRVRVVCRVRPLNQKEKETSEYVVSFPSSTTVGLGVSKVGEREREGRPPLFITLAS